MDGLSRTPKLVSIKEAAASIGIGEAAFRMRLYHGTIPSHVIIKIGARLHIDVAEFDRWLDLQRQ